jgi:DNA-binding IclR family transcriptional regulator
MRNMSRLARTRPADTGVGTVDRAVAVLDAVEQGSRSLADVVSDTGLSRTTAHRLLRSLEAHGFVSRGVGSGYRLGPRLLRLAAASLRESSVLSVAHPTLERLAAMTGESAQLFVAGVDGQRICVDAVHSTSELRTIVPIGSTLPITVGSAGKVFMAWMAEAPREDLVRRTEPLTPATPTGDRLRRQLSTARRRGWASSAGEREEGVGSVSAPIVGSGGEVVAVVSVSGPVTRVSPTGAKRYASAVTTAAREIERELEAASG